MSPRFLTEPTLSMPIAASLAKGAPRLRLNCMSSDAGTLWPRAVKRLEVSSL